MRHLGVEIELTGIRRKDLVKALEKFFHTFAKAKKSKTTEDGYIYHSIKDKTGNYWTVVRDRSIKPQKYINGAVIDLNDDDTDYMVELVSPVLSSETLPILFDVVSLIREMGGVVNDTCGIHVHIDRMSKDDCVGLFKRFVDKQDIIYKEFEITDYRKKTYCKEYSYIPLDNFEDIDSFLQFLWMHYRSDVDYNIAIEDAKSLRYYGLNFHSLLTHNTIEYRIFNSTLNTKEISNILRWVLKFSYGSEGAEEFAKVLL